MRRGRGLPYCVLMGTPGKPPSLVDVAVPFPVDKLFTYGVPEELRGRVKPGSRVLVPFGRRRVTGYVIAERSSAPGAVRIKELSGLVDEEPLLTGALLDLARWMSAYYLHPLGEVLKAVLPSSVKGKGRIGGEDETEGKFPAETEYPPLTGDQQTAFAAVCAALASGASARFLLHGVTGSGKTEVYLRCIEEALRMGKSALVLVPEIALIPQTTSRFRRRFGAAVAVLHSRLTGAQRAALWRGARRGEIRIVIGARSAVFVPLERLGIIVVDEEQDSSFKQEDKPRYNAVRAARFRAEREGAVLLLGSATPSLEAYAAARRGETGYLVLHSRPGGLEMPRVEIVDMRGRYEIFSEEMLRSLEGCIARREQAVILINRRGHANFVQCRGCGWIAQCPDCSISLTFHSRAQKLLCHYCGFQEEVPDACPRCGEYKIVHRGIGTERVEMELMNLLPGVRVARMDLDTTSGRAGHLAVLASFSSGEKDVLLGTQMVAKGHHYPNVTLIGVLTADRGLRFPDFRAAEKTFRLLFQAVGRTGRGEKGGTVLIQTYAGDHYLYQYLVRHDYEGFAARELEIRESLGYPPAGELMLFTVSSRTQERCERSAAAVAEALEKAAAPANAG
ncbi:MAG: primosomal protein N', partial [Candidatus Krumholzibacteria bacterium]|nr:primosomal protein N' [Candidatus Krumholzibacteria bacterium]